MINKLIIAGFLAGLAPVPKVTVAEWANENRTLSIANSVRPGKYEISYTPYLEDIGDDLSSHSSVEEIIFKKSNQVGATQLANNWIGSTIDNDPAPMLMVLPTEELAKRNSVLNIASMITETPTLLKKVGKARDRDSGNTTLRKIFPAGFLIMCGANSPNDARSTSFKKVIMDELSAYPVDMGGEGDPYKLFYGRTKTFSTKRKVFALSTPTTEGVCRISSLYDATDKRKYHIPCPHCGHLQHLVFDQIRYKEGTYDNVWYECIENGCRIEERHKPKMMSKAAGAKWISTAPANISPRKKGYHINALYAPYGQFSWGDMCREYDEAMNSENKDEAMKTFTNLHLGETWSQGGNITDYADLMDRTIEYKDGRPVSEVAILTAGVDIQKNRIEIETLGWAKHGQLYSVDYAVLEGSTDEPHVWDQLKDYLEADFERDDGSRMNIAYSCIDSGYLAYTVYEFCDKFGSSRCCPIKGVDAQRTVIGPAKTINYTKANQKKGTTLLKSVGSSVLKERIYSRLKLRIPKDGDLAGVVPNGYCWFPNDRSPYYFKGLCSEVYRVHEGKEQWVKIATSSRNEPLDLRVYALAAGEVIGIPSKPIGWFDDKINRFIPDRKEFTKKPVRERRKSDFWDGFDN
jgi:phage terminase large subunit GpA-like protein